MTYVCGHAAVPTGYCESNSTRDPIGLDSSAILKGPCGHFFFEGRAGCEIRRVLRDTDEPQCQDSTSKVVYLDEQEITKILASKPGFEEPGGGAEARFEVNRGYEKPRMEEWIYREAESSS